MRYVNYEERVLLNYQRVAQFKQFCSICPKLPASRMFFFALIQMRNVKHEKDYNGTYLRVTRDQA